MKLWNQYILLFMTAVAAVGCDVKPGREVKDFRSARIGNGDAVSQLADEAVESTVDPALIPADGEASLTGCNELGLVYVANTKSCGEVQASTPCCKDGLLDMFPSSKDTIESIFTEQSGLSLYNCGQVSTQGLKLHFSSDDGQGTIQYSSSMIKGKPRKTNFTCE